LADSALARDNPAVRRLGSAILASVLLGVPRALDARIFGARRPAYVQLAPESRKLAALAAELLRALREACLSKPAATILDRSPLIVDVHGLWRCSARVGPTTEMISATASDGRGVRRLIAWYPAVARAAAARALLRSLENGAVAVGQTAGS
jgi:hypothetical protein